MIKCRPHYCPPLWCRRFQLGSWLRSLFSSISRPTGFPFSISSGNPALDSSKDEQAFGRNYIFEQDRLLEFWKRDLLLRLKYCPSWSNRIHSYKI